MRAKPDMKPWVRTDKTNQSSAGAALSMRAFVLDRVVPPLWGSINVPITINPGLAPWAMQEYRPYRAPLRLPYHFIILMCLPCFVYEDLQKASSSNSYKKKRRPSVLRLRAFSKTGSYLLSHYTQYHRHDWA